jgi:inhibitor of KinA sporulation pathway (predicted exonuclease)
MKYFIDFEATEKSNEIISIGCVDENGNEFYSLVRHDNIEKLTDFIINLTGITPEDLENAPDVNEVFSDFYKWLDKTQKVEFYTYGYTDKIFVKRTLPYATDFYAQCGLALIRSNIINYCKIVNEHFGINIDISLKKVVEYYRGEEINQSHNALEDAYYLKEIYENMENDTVLVCPFPDHKKVTHQYVPSTQSFYKIKAISNNEKLTFYSLNEASNWVVDTIVSKSTPIITGKIKKNVRSSIRLSAKKKQLYCGYKWYIKKDCENQS